MFLLLFAIMAAAVPQSPPCPEDGGGCSAPFPPWGPYQEEVIGESEWLIGNVSLAYHIETLSTSLVVPKAPTSSQGTLVINPALENPSTFASFQIVLFSYQGNACNQTAEQWCMAATYWQYAFQPSSKLFPVGAGDTIRITYSYSPPAPGSNPLIDFGFIHESGSADSKRVVDLNNIPIRKSPIDASNNQPFLWWAKSECLCHSSGSIPQHTYLHTNITLNTTISDFNLSTHWNNTNSPLVYSSDGGRNWHIDELTLKETQCKNDYDCVTDPLDNFGCRGGNCTG